MCPHRRDGFLPLTQVLIERRTRRQEITSVYDYVSIKNETDEENTENLAAYLD